MPLHLGIPFRRSFFFFCKLHQYQTLSSAENEGCAYLQLRLGNNSFINGWFQFYVQKCNLHKC